MPETQGAFVRREAAFREVLEHAEAGRYHLYVSLACPWAHRAMIIRNAQGPGGRRLPLPRRPVPDERGWALQQEGATRTPSTASATSGGLQASDRPVFEGRRHRPRPLGQGADRSSTTSCAESSACSTPPSATPPSRPLPRGAARRDRRGQRPRLRRSQQRRLQGRLRPSPRTLRGGGRPLFDASTGSRSSRRQRYLVGDRLTDADLRCSRRSCASTPSTTATSSCNLPPPDRLPEPLGLRARPLPAARLRRNRRLRRDQAPLLHDPRPINPTRIVPLGPSSVWTRRTAAGSSPQPYQHQLGVS